MLNVVVGYCLCVKIFKLMQLVIKPQIVPMMKAMAHKKLSNEVCSALQILSSECDMLNMMGSKFLDA
uniref:Uncharacterized protein n=1 Tax=Romanomermis culicivorax TaxID=13658 RepID=A0A915JKW3_ROMCU